MIFKNYLFVYLAHPKLGGIKLNLCFLGARVNSVIVTTQVPWNTGHSHSFIGVRFNFVLLQQVGSLPLVMLLFLTQINNPEWNISPATTFISASPWVIISMSLKASSSTEVNGSPSIEQASRTSTFIINFPQCLWMVTYDSHQWNYWDFKWRLDSEGESQSSVFVCVCVHVRESTCICMCTEILMWERELDRFRLFSRLFEL